MVYNMKLYIVSTLIGNEVVNTGVYSSRENAELFCEKDPDTTIDELSLDQFVEDIQAGKKCYEVGFDQETNKVVLFEHLPYRFYDSDKTDWLNDEGIILKMFWANSADEALEIAKRTYNEDFVNDSAESL